MTKPSRASLNLELVVLPISLYLEIYYSVTLLSKLVPRAFCFHSWVRLLKRLGNEVSILLRYYILQDGVNWLAFLRKYKLHGILCDGMIINLFS